MSAPFTPPAPQARTRRIFFDRLCLQTHIGILEHELQNKQTIYLDAEFDTLIEAPSNDHDISSVLDYRLLRQHMINICTHRHVNLLETLIEELCATIFERFPSILWMKIRISKPQAFEDCAAVGIEMSLQRPQP